MSQLLTFPNISKTLPKIWNSKELPFESRQRNEAALKNLSITENINQIENKPSLKTKIKNEEAFKKL